MKKFLLLLMPFAISLLTNAQTIHFEPQTMEATLGQDTTDLVYTVVSNQGEDTLDLSFPAFVNRGSGGPDAYGYSWTDSDEEGGPNYEWIEISETGTQVTGLMDDNFAGPFEMGFTFPYYGQEKNQFFINSNGCITFSDHLLPFANMEIPTNNEHKNFIAWFWDDLTVDTSMTRVYYRNYEDKTVIQFNKMVHYPGSEDYITAEVILRHDGIIVMQYKEVRPGFESESGTVGLQSADSTIGLQVVYNAAYVHSELRINFENTQHFITNVTPASLSLAPGHQEHIWITYSSAGYAPGTYDEGLKCNSNDALHPLVILQNIMHVNNPLLAGFKGYVTDAASGEGINDVKVSVGEHFVYTNNQGWYEFPRDAGVYNVTFQREGYQSLTVEDTTALPGYSILDVQLNGFYFLTGRVWAADNAIESGFAYGYKMHEGIVTDIYAAMVGELGHYEFSGLETADYIVKAEPSPNSVYYGNYLPTYYGDVIHWEDAAIINLIHNMDGADIHLVPITNAPEGPGAIGGRIDTGTDQVSAADIQIVLRNLSSGDIFMSYSAADGTFEFVNLAFGTYEIYAEIAGKTVSPQQIVLDETNQSVQNIVMVILQDQIIFMGIPESPLISGISDIYPNPASEQISILLDLKKSSLLSLSVMDISGRVILQNKVELSGKCKAGLNIDEIPAGMYLLRISDESGAGIIRKFVKK